jgi:4-hydroxy-3-polyprenylbenzoate decarboxylase
VTFTRSPTGDRINVGSYRQALHSANRVGLNCVPGRHGILDCEAWWAQGKPCEVVAAYGIDPALLIAGAQGLGRDESELDFAGGLMGRPYELTQAEFVSLPIPARAEFVIEGLAHPGDVEMEGPLGEFHGFYSGDRAAKPVIQVKAVHYRRSPIMTASLMATYPACEMGAYHCIIRAARIHDSLVQNGMTGIRGVYVHPAAASGMCMAVVSLKQMRPGHAAQALALTAQCTAAPYLKWIIAVDEDVDPTDFDQVVWALSTRCNPSDDLDILRNTWTYRSDPSLAPEARPYGSKVLVNACAPHRYLKQAPKRTLLRREVYDRVSSRWSEFGFPAAPPAMKNFHGE